jgi:hypothetical protein
MGVEERGSREVLTEGVGVRAVGLLNEGRSDEWASGGRKNGQPEGMDAVRM